MTQSIAHFCKDKVLPYVGKAMKVSGATIGWAVSLGFLIAAWMGHSEKEKKDGFSSPRTFAVIGLCLFVPSTFFFARVWRNVWIKL